MKNHQVLQQNALTERNGIFAYLKHINDHELNHKRKSCDKATDSHFTLYY